MRTYLELYRAVKAGRRHHWSLQDRFGLHDSNEVDAALAPLRRAKIVRIVTQMFSGARHVEVDPDAEDESRALEMAASAGVDMLALF